MTDVIWRSGPIDRARIDDLGQIWIFVGMQISESTVQGSDLFLSGMYLLPRDIPKVFDWKIGYDRRA